MNKSVRRGLVIILSVMIAVIFAGCGLSKTGTSTAGSGNSTGGGGTTTGGGGTETQTTTAADLSDPTGKYEGTIDMSEMVGAVVGEQTGTQVSGTLLATLVMELNKDETYTIQIDLDQFFAATEDYYRQVMPQFIEALFEQEGISKDQIETAIKMQGYASYDEFVDAMVAASMEAVKEAYEEDSSTMMSEGTYSITDKEIKFYESSGDGTVTDHGTINSDGSITLYVDTNGTDTQIDFVKK